MREDQIDQAERQAVLENDRLVREQQKQREASTFFQHSQSLADETSGGRFRANGSPRLIGATPTPQYPQAGLPFQRDPVPDEPPLAAHENPALDETSTASPCVEATDGPADAPLSGMVQQPPPVAQRPSQLGRLLFLSRTKTDDAPAHSSPGALRTSAVGWARAPATPAAEPSRSTLPFACA